MHIDPPLLSSRAMHHAKSWWKVNTDADYASRKALGSHQPACQRIPHTLHQSWKTRELRPYHKTWQQTWLDNHPTWTYMFWTDKDNRDLIADKFPWFLSVYDSLPSPIERADCARYFYMLQYGGCYFDLDIESLKPLDPLLENIHVALGYMTQDLSHPLSIPNAFAASVPGHNFWMFVVKHILRNYESGKVDRADIFQISGPYMLKSAVEEYQTIKQDLTLFPHDVVYGVDYSWRDRPSMQKLFSVCHAANSDFNSTQCKTFFPEAYSVTYWSGDLTWAG